LNVFITIASDSEETTPGVSVSRNLVVPCGDASRLRTESNLEFSGLVSVAVSESDLFFS
jgi:hypothetical protein